MMSWGSLASPPLVLPDSHQVSVHPQLSLHPSLPQQSYTPTMSATEHPDQAVESVSAHCVLHAIRAS